jgi:hypothetical protein
MRTTLRIDDDLLRDLKHRAHHEKTSLTELVNRVIRRGMSDIPSANTRRPFRQETHDMGVPLVDITKALALAAELEDQEIIRKLELGK